jgi:hypothetical protein
LVEQSYLPDLDQESEVAYCLPMSALGCDFNRSTQHIEQSVLPVF